MFNCMCGCMFHCVLYSVCIHMCLYACVFLLPSVLYTSSFSTLGSSLSLTRSLRMAMRLRSKLTTSATSISLSSSLIYCWLQLPLESLSSHLNHTGESISENNSVSVSVFQNKKKIVYWTRFSLLPSWYISYYILKMISLFLFMNQVPVNIQNKNCAKTKILLFLFLIKTILVKNEPTFNRKLFGLNVSSVLSISVRFFGFKPNRPHH